MEQEKKNKFFWLENAQFNPTIHGNLFDHSNRTFLIFVKKDGHEKKYKFFVGGNECRCFSNMYQGWVLLKIAFAIEI